MPLRQTRISRMFEHLPLATDRPWLGYLVALLAVVVAVATRQALEGIIPPGYPFLTFFPVVILTAFFFGRGPGIACAILSGLAAWYLFIEPHDSFGWSRGIATAMLFYSFIVTVDIFLVHLAQTSAAHAIAERERNRQLAETRALLFAELQHRISNNLQVIGSLLSAQKRRVTDEQARAAIDEAANRLTVVGRISRELYRPDGGQSDMAEFLGRMSQAVFDASGRSDVKCLMDVEPDLTLAADRAVPLALVFTESLSNALELGLPDRAGTVRVAMRRRGEDRICLTIEDDGCGLSPGFTLDASPSLGLNIARQLARQLGGDYSIASGGEGKGTRAVLDIAA